MKTQKPKVQKSLLDFVNPNKYDLEVILEQLMDIDVERQTIRETQATNIIVQGIQHFWKLDWVDQYLNSLGLPTTSEIFLGFEIDMVYQPSLLHILNLLGVSKFNEMIMWEYLDDGYIKTFLNRMEQEHGSQVPSQMSDKTKSLWHYILVDNGITVDNFPWEELNNYMTHFNQLVGHNSILTVNDSNICE